MLGYVQRFSFLFLHSRCHVVGGYRYRNFAIISRHFFAWITNFRFLAKFWTVFTHYHQPNGTGILSNLKRANRDVHLFTSAMRRALDHNKVIPHRNPLKRSDGIFQEHPVPAHFKSVRKSFPFLVHYQQVSPLQRESQTPKNSAVNQQSAKLMVGKILALLRCSRWKR